MKVRSNDIILVRPLAAGVTDLPINSMKDGLTRGSVAKVTNYVNLSLDPRYPQKDQGMKAHTYNLNVGEEK